MKHSILIVDDEPTIRKLLVDAFSREPYAIHSAGSAKEGLEILERERADVVISDEIMPGMSGSEFLAFVRQKYPETIRMILTGHASLEAAIRAINEGEIYRFFTKPCNIFDLSVTVRQALQQKDLMEESRRLLRLVQEQSAFIEKMEKEYPGLTKVKRNANGVVIIDEVEEGGCQETDTLLKQIEITLEKHEALFPRERPPGEE
jgi:DNA-binding NtrC family response regulator